MKIVRPINKGGKWGLRLYKWFGAPLLSIARKLRHPIEMYGKELLYERLFSNGLSRLQLENRYYPTGVAANFSLMYILLRCITELPVRRVVELGCGQSTLLFDALRQLRPIEITTLEHDRDWARRIQKHVEHEITCADLVSRVIERRRTRLRYGCGPWCFARSAFGRRPARWLETLSLGRAPMDREWTQ